jgi:hypothetical protein
MNQIAGRPIRSSVNADHNQTPVRPALNVGLLCPFLQVVTSDIRPSIVAGCGAVDLSETCWNQTLTQPSCKASSEDYFPGSRVAQYGQPSSILAASCQPNDDVVYISLVSQRSCDH